MRTNYTGNVAEAGRDQGVARSSLTFSLFPSAGAPVPRARGQNLTLKVTNVAVEPSNIE